MSISCEPDLVHVRVRYVHVHVRPQVVLTRTERFQLFQATCMLCVCVPFFFDKMSSSNSASNFFIAPRQLWFTNHILVQYTLHTRHVVLEFPENLSISTGCKLEEPWSARRRFNL